MHPRGRLVFPFAAALLVAAQSLPGESQAQAARSIERAATQESTQASRRAIAAEPATIRIEPDQITAAPPATDVRAIDRSGAGSTVAPPTVSPATGAAGTLAAPPPGKLRITLTPKNPAVENRAYLQYDYPLTVDLAPGRNEVVYSPNNMPGWFQYRARLQKDRRYLVEIDARHRGTPGNVIHSIGGKDSTHDLGNGDSPIAAIVIPAKDGWVSGHLRQGTKPASNWAVHAVKITEMD